MSNVTKIRPDGSDLFHPDSRMDG